MSGPGKNKPCIFPFVCLKELLSFVSMSINKKSTGNVLIETGIKSGVLPSSILSKNISMDNLGTVLWNVTLPQVNYYAH